MKSDTCSRPANFLCRDMLEILRVLQKICRYALQVHGHNGAVCVLPQVRQELLACITSVHGALRDQLTADDVRLILGWLDRFARFPFAAGT